MSKYLFSGIGSSSIKNSIVNIENMEYTIKFEDKKELDFFVDYVGRIIEVLNYDDFIFGSLRKDLKEYSNNINDKIEDNSIIIDKINLKTLKLELNLILNELDYNVDEDKGLFIDIAYLIDMVDSAKEL